MDEQKQWDLERLEGLKEDMADDLKSLQQAEESLINETKWRDSAKVSYANSVIKYYELKNEVENK